MWGYEEERESSLAQDHMSQSEWTNAALRQWADVYGAENPEVEYISTPYDTWELNPHYRGPKGRHPEDDYDEDGRHYMEDAAPVAAPVNPQAPWLEPGEDDIPF